MFSPDTVKLSGAADFFVVELNNDAFTYASVSSRHDPGVQDAERIIKPMITSKIVPLINLHI